MVSGKRLPLMPKATAVWLIDNTSLTFRQIADFCGMHELEVKSIADEQSAMGIVGIDPVFNGFLTKDEIDRCTSDESANLDLSHNYKAIEDVFAKSSKRKYIPLKNRRDKPDAISWILKHCPGMEDGQIIKLIGTTRVVVNSVRGRTHWNSANVRPRDPVLLGLCTQTELDDAINRLKVLQK